MIPGYSGYMPHLVNGHRMGKTKAELARDLFNESQLDTPQNGFSSTGFNHALISKIDEQLHATSQKYGKSTIIKTARNLHADDYTTTTTRASYLSPAAIYRPNWRTRDNSVQLDNSEVLRVKELLSDKLASGYSANR